MKLPKKLYRYDINRRLETVTVIDSERLTYSADDNRWSYQVAKFDEFKNSMFYGYSNRRLAILENIERTERDILKLKTHLKNLKAKL